MTRGNRPSANAAPTGTSHHELANERTTEIAPETCSPELVQAYAEGLPAGTARDLFLRATEELSGKGVLRDFDLQFLQQMALHLWNAERANTETRNKDVLVSTEYGKRPNPALKIARDEEAAAMKIADQYGLTFVSRLRAGILQLAGQSMLEQMYENVAASIVARILAHDRTERAVFKVATKDALPSSVLVCEHCARDGFKSPAGLASHKRSCPGRPRKRTNR